MTNPVERIAAHVTGTQYENLPETAVAKVRTFLLDTLGVGIAGSSGAGVADLVVLARGWGAQDEATVWLTGERMSAGSAAIVNAYQIHCLEFDCVHEGAVLHPMATILSAVLAWAERSSARGRPVAGRELVTALAVGVDVSTMLGIVTDAPIRFFRPATAGGFGAVAAIAHLARFTDRQVMDALGAQYAQCSGTLQPHVEGSPMLGMQVGFNARAAIMSADLAQAGFRGPHEIFTGQYNYFRLFEGEDCDLDAFLPSLGRDWQIEAMSHKPWPSGRLTHGVVDGLARLMRDRGFTADDVVQVRADVPPLVHRLVGRPMIPAPEANYAKLCLRFVAGCFMARGRVDVPDFRGDALRDPHVHEQAAKVDVVLDGNPDENALDPQTITVRLTTGVEHAITLPHVFGHPAVALTDAQNAEKFRRCAGYGQRPLPDPDRMIGAVAGIAAMDDIAALPRLTLGSQK